MDNEISNNDLELAKEVLITEGITSAVKKVHQEYTRATLQISAPVVPIRKHLAMRVSLAAAAVLILVTGLWWFNSGDTAPSLYAQAWIEYRPEIQRGTATQEHGIAAAYAAGKYETVIVLSKSKTPLTMEERLLAGLSYLKTKNYGAAELVLEGLTADNKAAIETSFNDEAEYYLALTLLAKGKTASAAELMRTIAAKPGHTFQNKFTPDFIAKVAALKKD